MKWDDSKTSSGRMPSNSFVSMRDLPVYESASIEMKDLLSSVDDDADDFTPEDVYRKLCPPVRVVLDFAKPCCFQLLLLLCSFRKWLQLWLCSLDMLFSPYRFG